MPDLEDEEEQVEKPSSDGPRPARLLPLILIFLLLIVLGGGYAAIRFVPSVRQAVQKLPVIGRLAGSSVTETPVDPLVSEKLQLEQEKAATQQLQDQLTKLQADLQAKEAELAQRETAAQQLMTDATALKTQYEAKLATLDQQVKLYTAMKADKAAAVMNELPDEDVARILAKMDTATAAKILAYLQPARVARILSLMGS